MRLANLFVVDACRPSLAPLSLFAKCQISPDGRLELRAPAGNLLVSTTGTDSVEVQVSNRQVTVQETCERDKVTITGKAPDEYRDPGLEDHASLEVLRSISPLRVEAFR